MAGGRATRQLLLAVHLTGCREGPCGRETRARVSDEEAVGGATGQEVIAATAGAFASLPVVWEFGGEVTVDGSLMVDAGSARRETNVFTVECVAEQLVQTGIGSVSTSDGRLDEAPFEGETAATAPGGVLQWSFLGEWPWEDAQQAFSRDELDIHESLIPDAIRLYISGSGEEVERLQFEWRAHMDESDGTFVGALGLPP